jgi:hypothetical protein
MSKVLIKWESNWADEMDISGFMIVSKAEAKEFKADLRNKKQPFEIYVGTNEEISYENGKELLDELEFINLSKAEADIIEQTLGSEYGFTDFASIEEDEEELNEEQEDYEEFYEDED